MVEATRKKNRADIIKRRLNDAFAKHPKQTNKALADHCSVTEQAVWKWRRTGKVSRDNIAQVASFFGERPNWLMDDMTEVREPDDARYGLSRSEKALLEAIRKLPPEVAADLERYVATLSKTFAKHR